MIDLQRWYLDRIRPKDRSCAEASLVALYQSVDKPPPDHILWLDSPASLMLAQAWVARAGRAQTKFLDSLLSTFRSLGSLHTRTSLQEKWDRSLFGQRLLSRHELTARALAKERSSKGSDWPKWSLPADAAGTLADLFGKPDVPQQPKDQGEKGKLALSSMGVKVITYGVVDSDPIPWGLNLGRFWGAIYAAETLLPESAWVRALAGLVATAGWAVLFDEVALLCEPPQQPLSELPEPELHHINRWPAQWGLGLLEHNADGPALTWPDGWSIWAWEGMPVPRHVIENPQSLTPEEILSQQDPAVRRAMLELRGPSLLDSSTCTAEFRREVEAVEKRRFVRFTRADLPRSAVPWPAGMEVPWPMRSGYWPKLPSGTYYLEHPGGGLRFVAKSHGGTVDSWLLLDEHTAMAYAGNGWYYYRNGFVEAFGPYADDDPWLCEQSFREWVQERI